MAEPAQQLGPYDKENEGEGPNTRPKFGVIQGGGEGDGNPKGNLHSVGGSSGKKNSEQGGRGKKGGAGSLGDAAKTAKDVVGLGYNPEGTVAKKGLQKVKDAVTGGGDKKKRNGFFVGAVAAIVLIAFGLVILFNFLFNLKAQQLVSQVDHLESKLLDKSRKDVQEKTLQLAIKKAANRAAAKQAEAADKNDPLAESVDTEATSPHVLDEYFIQKGLTPVYDAADNLKGVKDGSGKFVSTDDPAFSGVLDTLGLEDDLKTGAPLAVVGEGAPLNIYDPADPKSKSTDPKTLQSELTEELYDGQATSNAITNADGETNAKPPKKTGDPNKDASNAAKFKDAQEANGPLEDSLVVAQDAASKGATASVAIAAGIADFKAKVAASVTDKLFITGMITVACNLEKGIQTASNKRIPIIMTMVIRDAGQLKAFVGHQRNPGDSPLTPQQDSAMLKIVTNNPDLVKPTPSDPQPEDDMPADHSAEVAAAEGIPITNTTDPSKPHYTPAQDSSAKPSRIAAQNIVDAVASFMHTLHLDLACAVLTSAFGIIFQLAAGIGQFIASIGSFGTADAAILASNIALQQFIFSFVLPQAIGYFTNLSVGLNSPVPYINNVGVGINLTSGQTTRAEGGLPITRAATKKLLVSINNEQFQEEQQKPFMYRAFALDNPYSLTTRLVNKLPALNSQGLFASISSYFVGLPSTIGSIFSNITSAHVFAASNSVQLNPNTVDITQYYYQTKYDPIENEYYLRDPSKNPAANVTVDGKTATRIKMLGDPYAYQLSPDGDTDNNDLLHCFVDPSVIMTDQAGGNPNQKFCGALGRYDYVYDDPQKLGIPDDNTVTNIYCAYFGNPPNCKAIVRPQVHDDVGHFSQYLASKAAMDAITGLTGAN